MIQSLGLIEQSIVDSASNLFSSLESLDLDQRIAVINAIRAELHKHSPFAAEPVDCVIWVKSDSIQGNSYNPNKVAPPEMKLLELSVAEDGYTQPIVTWKTEQSERAIHEVIDGFHRHLLPTMSKTIKKRLMGYLPVVVANAGRTSESDRMASTIRHNRARGKHQVEAMSSIVTELVRRGWDNEKIAKELGMDADEVLRLKQITGLAEMFADREFSEAWEIEEVTNEHS